VEPGYVFLSRGDMEALCAALNLAAGVFQAAYCRWVPSLDGLRLSLREKANYDCVFWQEGGCSVYAARPLQCRTFPFWSQNLVSRKAWEEEMGRCPGMDKGTLHSCREIEARLEAQRRNPILTREGSLW
jgi:Fe-S-cluster containining protein